METWRSQLEGLKIPYPQKQRVVGEVADHIAHCPEESRDVFAKENLRELYEIHNTRLLRTLERLSPRLRLTVELLFAAAPLMVLMAFLTKEDFMLNFIQEGGAGMWAILAIGMLLLAKEVFVLFRVIIVKDHAREHLALDTMAVIVGTSALVLLGIGSTALGAYYSASYFLKAGNLPIAVLVQGLSESITCLIVSATLAASILLLHFLVRQTLLSWKVPREIIAGAHD